MSNLSTKPTNKATNKANETICFMYFANNFPFNWINSVWSDSMAKHLSFKWDVLNQSNELGGTLNFFKFFMLLDNENQTILIEWINNNYKK